MAENEVFINEEEKELSVGGGENELKFKEKEEELKIQQQKKAEEQKPADEEGKEGVVENDPNEDTPEKSNRWEFEHIKEQDISQYLWDTLLKYVNKFNEYIYNKCMDAIDRRISKSETGPAAPEAPKEKKAEHTKKRGAKLYDLRSAVTEDFAKSVNEETLGEFLNKQSVILRNSTDPEKDKKSFKNLLVRANGIAYDMAVSELLHEKISKDKNFDFATMDTKSLINEAKTRVPEKFERLITGSVATAHYAEIIDGMNSSQALKSCDEYLNIRENESNAIKNLITQDLDAGNFVANGKNPSRDIGVKINAYNRSFDNDAVVVNSSLKEMVSYLEKSNLSAEEKVNLAEFQKKINLSQQFENATILDLQKQIKAIDAAYKANKSNPIRAKINAMKKANGFSPIANKMAQKYANNAILQAANKAKGGRR